MATTAGQTPAGGILPPVPKDLVEPFWYASLQSLWLFWTVDLDLLRRHVGISRDLLEVAPFTTVDGDRTGLLSLDFQIYTGHGASYLTATHEVELNVYVFPAGRVHEAPLMSWQNYLMGQDQTKTIGGLRLRVPCDNSHAIAAGRELYGEPKYPACFTYTAPTLNQPPDAEDWSYAVYQAVGTADPPAQGPLVYSLDAALGPLVAQPANPAPLIEYGTVVDDGVTRAIGNLWNFYGPFRTYLLDDGVPRVSLAYGNAPDPAGMRELMQATIGTTQPVAAQAYTSPPVSVEMRGWYQSPRAP